MNRRSFLQQAAGGSLLISSAGNSTVGQDKTAGDDNLKLFWGDLHAHCNITYGHGSMQDALEAATQQLDFCSIVAHALWPDPPLADQRIAAVVEYHLQAFERLRQNWTAVQDLNLQYYQPGKFIPILGYECHSMQDGDHNVYNTDHRAGIVEANSIANLKQQLQGTQALVIPHHIGYMKGYRGFNWDSFTESDQTPFIEIYSRHGGCERDTGSYPMLHTMGPRSHEGTVEVGLQRGHKFGMMASTDQHGGYPGSYGDGRMAVYARELTMEALWEAFKARRIYGTTGEKIVVDFRLNNAWMGEAVSVQGGREINLTVQGNDFLDYVDIIKNGKRLKRFSVPHTPIPPAGDTIRAKLRVEWGWNREEGYTEWEGVLELLDGRIIEATPCFRGLPVTGPQEGLAHNTKVSRILENGASRCAFHSFTSRNPNTLTPTTDSIVLDVEMPKNAQLRVTVNGKTFQHTLAELLEGTRSHFLRGWLSEAVAIHRAVPVSGFLIEETITDNQPEQETDYYYVRARQLNDQWAWSSPIWVSRS
jgi:hypothetical protein